MEVGLKFCLLPFGELQKLQFTIRNKRQHSACLTNDALDSFDFFFASRVDQKQLKKLSVALYEMISMDE